MQAIIRIILPFILFLSLLHAQDQAIVADEGSSPLQVNMQPYQKDFLNLPEEDRIQAIKYFDNANRLLQQKRIFECLDAISEAEAIFPRVPEFLNLRAVCYVEIRAFDKAMVILSEAQKLSPKDFNIRFNIGEILFVTKQWQKAHEMFEEVLREIPTINTSLARLVEFKMLLCKVKLGQKDEVTILAQKYDYLDDSPYYYYAQAALAFEKKEPLEAEGWVGRAKRIFPASIIAQWEDTLIEFGYVQGHYGGDAATAAEN